VSALYQRRPCRHLFLKSLPQDLYRGPLSGIEQRLVGEHPGSWQQMHGVERWQALLNSIQALDAPAQVVRQAVQIRCQHRVELLRSGVEAMHLAKTVRQAQEVRPQNERDGCRRPRREAKGAEGKGELPDHRHRSQHRHRERQEPEPLEQRDRKPKCEAHIAPRAEVLAPIEETQRGKEQNTANAQVVGRFSLEPVTLPAAAERHGSLAPVGGYSAKSCRRSGRAKFLAWGSSSCRTL